MVFKIIQILVDYFVNSMMEDYLRRSTNSKGSSFLKNFILVFFSIFLVL